MSDEAKGIVAAIIAVFLIIAGIVFLSNGETKTRYAHEIAIAEIQARRPLIQCGCMHCGECK